MGITSQDIQVEPLTVAENSALIRLVQIHLNNLHTEVFQSDIQEMESSNQFIAQPLPNSTIAFWETICEKIKFG